MIYYRTVIVTKPVGEATLLAGEINHAMTNLNEDAYDVIAAFPICGENGRTEAVAVLGRKTDDKPGR